MTLLEAKQLLEAEMSLFLGRDNFTLRRHEDERGILLVQSGADPKAVAQEKINRWKSYERGEL